MTVKVERFTPNPEHGRPMVASFTGREGRLAVHCSREDGSLWLFAEGPKGGDRGTVVVPVRQAGAVLAWVDDEDAETMMPSTGRGYLALRYGGVMVGVPGWSRDWRMKLDPVVREELRTCLREWANAAVRLDG